MADYGNELALLWCLALNAAVLAACWRFATRRLHATGAQAVLDAGLLWYAVQYASVCLPGTVGALRPITISAMAILISVALWLVSGSRGPLYRPAKWPLDSWLLLVIGLFSTAYIFLFGLNQRWLPVMSNDAMTYHFPAAVQWLQTGRLGLFQVWFFNPANTFSPLAGSTFIAWLLAPFGNDVLARVVEMPALLLIGLALFQLCRQLEVEPVTAALVAAAAILSRPLFFPSIMGKDDLFVVLFFVCALLALTEKGTNRFRGFRAGLAIGLLLATKYSAIISAIPLLFAFDQPIRARWRMREWYAAFAIAAVIAGPWYLRNWIITGNAIFPVRVLIFRGLFTIASSQNLHTIDGVWTVLTGGNYGLPLAMFGLTGLGWCAWIIRNPSKTAIGEILKNPLKRTCLIGPVAGLALFIGRSPFPEVRFVLPSFLLLFAGFAAGIEIALKHISIRRLCGMIALLTAVTTAFVTNLRKVAVDLTFGSLLITAVGGIIVLAMIRGRAKLRATISCITIVLASAWIYVNWSAYMTAYQRSRGIPTGGWGLSYPSELSLWQFCQDQIPADSVIACTNTYLTYPLQGFSLDRRVVYIPTRAGVSSQSDLPWLGDHLSGEQLIAAATAATIANPSHEQWLTNLQKSGAGFLVIVNGETTEAPETRFVASDPLHFHKLFSSDGGSVFKIEW